jgi:thiamine pyrophosphate-dependent acetolactate synthase large subunit-like protein
MKMTGGEILLRSLKVENVPFVFGIVGGRFMSFLRQVALEPTMEYIGTRHEASAAHMAAAVFHSTGKMGICLGEMGPGSVNLVPGVQSAYNNNIPMLVMTSNNPNRSSYPFHGMFMDFDAENLFKPITKWNAVVRDGKRIPELVQWAFREALSGKPGPVHLDFSADALSHTVEVDESIFDVEPQQYRVIERPRSSVKTITQAVDILMKAERPLLLAGGGVVASQAKEEFRKLAKFINAPATATQMGTGVVSTTDPNYIGQGGIIGGDAITRALQESDVILAVGCRFSSWLWGKNGPLSPGGPLQKVIHIDIDPSIIGKLTRVEVGIQGDAKAVLRDILDLLSMKNVKVDDREWTKSLVETYRTYREQLSQLLFDDHPVLHPAILAKEIGEFLPDQSLVVFDGGHTTFWSNDFTPILEPRTRFHEPGNSQLGYGTPYAHAIKLLYPDRPVFSITGDGSFGFSLQELDTARRYGIQVIHIIHNNSAWGIQQSSQRNMYNYSYGVDLSETNYANIARGFGCYGERVSHVEEIKPAIKRALASGLPAVIDVEVRFESHPAKKYIGAMSSAGLKTTIK